MSNNNVSKASESSEPKKPKLRKFVASRKFGSDDGTVEIGDVVMLTAKDAKRLNKAKALLPFIEDGDEDDE